MKTEKTPKNIELYLAAIEDNIKKLNSWEVDFFHSISKRWEEKGRLSDKQFENLEDIYIHKT